MEITPPAAIIIAVDTKAFMGTPLIMLSMLSTINLSSKYKLITIPIQIVSKYSDIKYCRIRSLDRDGNQEGIREQPFF